MDRGLLLAANVECLVVASVFVELTGAETL
jgi:hypothetical protein